MSIKKISILFISFGLMLLSFPADGAEDADYLMTGHNTARRINIRASSRYSINNGVIKVMDADRESCWISSGSLGPQWVSVDFGSKRLITSIVVYPGRKDNYRTITYFKLQFLKENWFDFATFQTEKKGVLGSSYRDKIEIDLAGVDASTFRIFIPADAMMRGFASIAEIEIYTGASKLKFFDERLSGLCLPIRNAYLPVADYSYPNAPRTYRGGRHSGIDISTYHDGGSYDPLPVTDRTPVFAVDGGVVIRADHDYTGTGIDEWKQRSVYYRTHPSTYMRNGFGGREVWIDHGNGVVTTYNHLSSIDRSILQGRRIFRGSRIGMAGNSGLAGEAAGNKQGIHLHFEIWIDGNYLGYGMSIQDIRKYFTWIFSKSR
jgi:murein DD-endopeptidase MepM/ murein hydrolase activator NlpD